MTDIFREVDEEVRRDRAAEFWKKHGNLLIGIAVLFVAAVGGWQYWKTEQFKARAALGARFEAAIADLGAGKPDADAALTALAKDNGESYPALARFRLASDLAAKAKDDAARANAVSAFETLSKDASLPAEWREIAQLRAALVLVDHAGFEEVEKRLQPLISPTGALRHSAREALALSAWRNGKFDKALDTLQAVILDPESPANLRQRSEILLAVVRSGPTQKP